MAGLKTLNPSMAVVMSRPGTCCGVCVCFVRGERVGEGGVSENRGRHAWRLVILSVAAFNTRYHKRRPQPPPPQGRTDLRVEVQLLHLPLALVHKEELRGQVRDGGVRGALRGHLLVLLHRQVPDRHLRVFLFVVVVLRDCCVFSRGGWIGGGGQSGVLPQQLKIGESCMRHAWLADHQRTYRVVLRGAGDDGLVLRVPLDGGDGACACACVRGWGVSTTLHILHTYITRTLVPREVRDGLGGVLLLAELPEVPHLEGAVVRARRREVRHVPGLVICLFLDGVGWGGERA